MSVLNLYPRSSLQARSDISDDGEYVESGGGYNVFYGITVVCLTIFLFCVLATSVSVWKALAFAALAALLLSVAGCFAPKRWYRRRRRSSRTAAELVVTVTAAATATGTAAWHGAPAAGYYASSALVNAPPAFAYECPVKARGGSDGEPKAAASSCCAVCLEDVRGGEMVRQVPACSHIFHVECIDMWLHTHRTCPMCRCMVSPPPPKGSSPAAAEEAPQHQSSAEELPPV